MDERVVRQESIKIIATQPSRPEVMLRFHDTFEDHEIIIRYVPDQYRLPIGGVEQYLSLIPSQVWGDVDEVAYTIMDDLNNQLVPKWVQVIVHFGSDSALIEDRQPAWQNAPLLSRQVVY